MTGEPLKWPPRLTQLQLIDLRLRATTYALGNGLLYLPPHPPEGAPSYPSSAVHAPLSIVPSPLPRPLFEKAWRIQHIYNVLYARVACDTEFLDEVMEPISKVDGFVGHLWNGWKLLRGQSKQELHLGLFRSDYLLHCAPDKPRELKQVEFNTISSSFGPLSERASKMHRYLCQTTSYFNASHYLSELSNFPSNETTKGLVAGLAEAHKAYGAPDAEILFVIQPNERNVFDQRYLEYELLATHNIRVVRQTFAQLGWFAHLDELTGALMLEVDGRIGRIQYKKGKLPEGKTKEVEISVVYFRAGYTPLDYPDSRQFQTRFLIEISKAIKCPTIPLQLAGSKKVQEVLTRPGVLERFLQRGKTLVSGSEETFTDEEIKELRASWVPMWSLDVPPPVPSFYASPDHMPPMPPPPPPPPGQPPQPPPPPHVWNKDDAGAWAAVGYHANLVLKPQREGGGNNVYKAQIPPFIKFQIPKEQRKAWIAMMLISVPEDVGGYLVRTADSAGKSEGLAEKENENERMQREEKKAKKKKEDWDEDDDEEMSAEGEDTRIHKTRGVISELGIFGWALFQGTVSTPKMETLEIKEESGEGGDERKDGRDKGLLEVDMKDDTVGWLVRTKGVESDEGGVAAGFSVLDSLVLVD